MKKKVFILGSTGTIGLNTLDVIKRFKDDFEVVGLTAFNNVALIEKQVKQFKPKYVAVGTEGVTQLRKGLNGSRTKIFDVESDLADLVSGKDVDIVVIGMSGSAALKPFLRAVQKGKRVAPANKEALVMAGDIITREAQKNKAEIIPIDSEQSAIFQCLQGQPRRRLKKIYLTASGGPLLNLDRKKFDRLSVKEILKHPRWKMGKKITVDSATLMNKGFEMIEAKHLFGLKMNEIEVVVHPQAIIHSMAGFNDGSIMAQLSITDMRLPIQYALTYPDRPATHLKDLDFFELKELTFKKPDYNKFPALSLARYVGEKGGTSASVMNAADEVAVGAFLDRKIKLTDIFKVVEKIVLKHKNKQNYQVSDVLAADQWARQETQGLINSR